MKTIKKSISLIITAFCCLIALSAGESSETKKFSLSTIKNIEVELMFESLTVSICKGNQIIVVVESMNDKMFPQITSENKTLKIHTTHPKNKAFDNKALCDISLMLPEKYVAEKISIKAPYKKLDIQKMNAKTVSIIPGTENSLANITADYFEIPLPDQADINIYNLDCNSFSIKLLAGDANISLVRVPEKESKLSVKEGKLNVSIPSDSEFTILADSYHSKFINNFTGTEDTWARGGVTYKHNGGGTKIELQTFRGDITVGTKNFNEE